MPSAILEQMGYVLWEGLVLVCMVVGSLAFVMLRRNMSGRPTLRNQYWKLLFNNPLATVSKPKLCLRFALAVLLFSCIGVFEVLVFAQLGAAILSISLLVSCAGIVNIILL